jgi:hypothetical protein
MPLAPVTRKPLPASDAVAATRRKGPGGRGGSGMAGSVRHGMLGRLSPKRAVVPAICFSVPVTSRVRESRVLQSPRGARARPRRSGQRVGGAGRCARPRRPSSSLPCGRSIPSFSSSSRAATAPSLRVEASRSACTRRALPRAARGRARARPERRERSFRVAPARLPSRGVAARRRDGRGGRIDGRGYVAVRPRRHHGCHYSGPRSRRRCTAPASPIELDVVDRGWCYPRDDRQRRAGTVVQPQALQKRHCPAAGARRSVQRAASSTISERRRGTCLHVERW